MARYIRLTVAMNRSPLGRIIALYREVKHNYNVVKRIGYKGGLKLFRTGVWEIHKNNIDYLPEDIRKALNALYEEIYRVNDDVQSVQGKGESFLMSVNTDRVAAPLRENSLLLDRWITKNINNPEVAPKRPGFFGI